MSLKNSKLIVNINKNNPIIFDAFIPKTCGNVFKDTSSLFTSLISKVRVILSQPSSYNGVELLQLCFHFKVFQRDSLRSRVSFKGSRVGATLQMRAWVRILAEA